MSGLPMLQYDPLGNGQLKVITLPAELTTIDARQVPAAARVRTPGAVVGSHRGYSFDVVTIEIAELGYSEALEDDMRKFDAFAGQGGEFLFALDSATGAYSVLLNDEPANDPFTLIELQNPPIFGTFQIQRHYRIRRRDASAQQVVYVTTFGISGLAVNIRGKLRAAYSPGDLFHDLDTYPRAVRITDGSSLKEIPGLKQQFAMTFRTNRGITVD